MSIVSGLSDGDVTLMVDRLAALDPDAWKHATLCMSWLRRRGTMSIFGEYPLTVRKHAPHVLTEEQWDKIRRLVTARRKAMASKGRRETKALHEEMRRVYRRDYMRDYRHRKRMEAQRAMMRSLGDDLADISEPS